MVKARTTDTVVRPPALSVSDAADSGSRMETRAGDQRWHHQVMALTRLP
jgi:hypothetical protein